MVLTHKGLFYGGGFYLLIVQLLGTVAICVWAGGLTFLSFVVIERTVGLRKSYVEVAWFFAC